MDEFDLKSNSSMKDSTLLLEIRREGIPLTGSAEAGWLHVLELRCSGWQTIRVSEGDVECPITPWWSVHHIIQDAPGADRLCGVEQHDERAGIIPTLFPGAICPGFKETREIVHATVEVVE